MTSEQRLLRPWDALPVGARGALEHQWFGLAAGGLPCGSTVIDATGSIIAAGRNHAYDQAGALETRVHTPLQHTRLAHAELNALALVPTDTDHSKLTLWTTQHPCSMCAAALHFIGVGQVCFVADDLSDDSPPEAIAATRRGVPYQPLNDPLWWTVSNLLFLYTSAVQQGMGARNIEKNYDRYPELINLTLDLAKHDTLGQAARSGAPLPSALASHITRIECVAAGLTNR